MDDPDNVTNDENDEINREEITGKPHHDAGVKNEETKVKARIYIEEPKITFTCFCEKFIIEV